MMRRNTVSQFSLSLVLRRRTVSILSENMRPEERMDAILGEFKNEFSKPRFENFTAYEKDIINVETRRTIVHINKGSGERKDQSQLNRFVTHPKVGCGQDMQTYQKWGMGSG